MDELIDGPSDNHPTMPSITRVCPRCKTCASFRKVKAGTKATRGERIPISAAQEIACKYGYDQVAIFAFTRDDKPRTHITTYGTTKKLCKEVGECAPKVAEFAGWIQPQTDTANRVHTITMKYDIDGFVIGCVYTKFDGTELRYGITTLEEIAKHNLAKNKQA